MVRKKRAAPPHPNDSRSVVTAALVLGAVWAVALAAFLPVFDNGFVNWDDPVVIVRNASLAAPGVVRWAWSTTLIGHYQPIAWLAWALVERAFGVDAAAFHSVSVVAHLVNAGLLFLVVWQLVPSPQPGATSPRVIAAATAAALFAVHPIQVEAVAWASALPYVLSVTALLAAVLAYLRSCVSNAGGRANAWLGASVAAYAVSLLTRAIAVGLPLVLLVIDVYPLRRIAVRGVGRSAEQSRPARAVSIRRVLLEKIPFLALALAAVAIEARTRDVATLQEVGAAARAQLAVTAPFVYFWRIVVPIHLSPLHPLPIHFAVEWMPLVLGAAGLLVAAMLIWKGKTAHPAIGAACLAYAVLLAPVAGLTPSGLQATADRYVYVPALALALIAGAAAGRASTSRSARTRMLVPVSVCALVVVLAVAARVQLRWWHDSIALWTRAAELDPHDDIATYNLATALADAGREDEAIAQYEETLRLVPDHDLARQNLAILQAARAEREGDRLAAAGRLDEATDQYARALALDGKRLHARAALGIALVRRGRLDEGAADLQRAFDAGSTDAEVPNALAFALTTTGRTREAIAVLGRAVDRSPGDVNLVHNLARLLATTPDPQLRDGQRALRLALQVRDWTGGRDPRALDTLAAAYAAAGQPDHARETADRAVTLARQAGDGDLADAIAAHARSYAR